ncbi:hypothetical protein, partial [Staphylococcus coagulans]|uniref:hypothetical protein n=1 Tax=Staphylococcus coagulans TaxID=74706 RepID=UPI001BE899A1
MAGLRLRFFKLCATLHIFAGAGRRNQIDFCPAFFVIHISLKAQLMAGLRLRFFKLCATLHIFAGA